MTIKKHEGGCHCGRVRYSVELDLAEPTTKCNCTYCRKARAWTSTIKPASFRLLSGRDCLIDYHKHEQAPVKHFCGTCGITVFANGDADWMGGPYVTVFISTLDDATPEELESAPVRFCNGRDNLWQESPKVTGYL
jgi:hypothetical protein